MTSDLLLVGSLPVNTSEEGLRAGAELFAERVFALPDGESGPLSAWVGYDRTSLLETHPDIEMLAPSPSPTGRARHAWDTARLTVRPGISKLHFEHWPRISEAIAGYQVYRQMRDAGTIPASLRYQIGLPLPSSVFSGAFKDHYADDWAIVGPALEDLYLRSIDQLLSAIPAEDLALQWDMAYEVQDLEGVISWSEGDPWERFAGPLARIVPAVPREVLTGLHFCYGTFPEWPMYEARDLGLLVRMANHAVTTLEGVGRPVDWIHLAGPRNLRSAEDAFFAPLADLDIPDTRVFLGIVLPLDGEQGLRLRHQTASRHLDDFGVAMYCGFGRQPGQDPQQTLREHASVMSSIYK